LKNCNVKVDIFGNFNEDILGNFKEDILVNENILDNLNEDILETVNEDILEMSMRSWGFKGYDEIHQLLILGFFFLNKESFSSSLS